MKCDFASGDIRYSRNAYRFASGMSLANNIPALKGNGIVSTEGRLVLFLSLVVFAILWVNLDRISKYIDRLLQHINPTVRWILMPFISFSFGFGAISLAFRYSYLFIMPESRYYITEGAEIGLIVLDFLFPGLLFVELATSIAPSHKVVVCNVSSIVLFSIYYFAPILGGVIDADESLYYVGALIVSLIVALIVRSRVLRALKSIAPKEVVQTIERSAQNNVDDTPPRQD